MFVSRLLRPRFMAIEKRMITDNSRRKKKSYQPIHLSQKPPASSDIDFNSLELKFPVVKDTTFIVPRLGWAPPPTEPPSLPFMVERTLIGHHFPVYTEFKGGGTKVVTILRKISGDIETLRTELQKVVGLDIPIEARPGKLVVRGNFVLRVKKYLLGIGF